MSMSIWEAPVNLLDCRPISRDEFNKVAGRFSQNPYPIVKFIDAGGEKIFTHLITSTREQDPVVMLKVGAPPRFIMVYLIEGTEAYQLVLEVRVADRTHFGRINNGPSWRVIMNGVRRALSKHLTSSS